MVRFLKFIVIVPIALLLLMFAFANRQVITVSFDPFEAGDVPAFVLKGPLFLVLILAVALGVICGGVATWFAQGKHRRAERAHRAEAEKLRGELETARASVPLQPALARRA